MKWLGIIYFFLHVLYGDVKDEVLYTPYISRGFYFCEFRESGAIRKFNNTRK